MPYRPQRTMEEKRRDEEKRRADEAKARVSRATVNDAYRRKGTVITADEEELARARVNREAREKAAKEAERIRREEEAANNAAIRERVMRGKRNRPEER